MVVPESSHDRSCSKESSKHLPAIITISESALHGWLGFTGIHLNSPEFICVMRHLYLNGCHSLNDTVFRVQYVIKCLPSTIVVGYDRAVLSHCSDYKIIIWLAAEPPVNLFFVGFPQGLRMPRCLNNEKNQIFRYHVSHIR